MNKNTLFLNLLIFVGNNLYAARGEKEELRLQPLQPTNLYTPKRYTPKREVERLCLDSMSPDEICNHIIKGGARTKPFCPNIETMHKKYINNSHVVANSNPSSLQIMEPLQQEQSIMDSRVEKSKKLKELEKWNKKAEEWKKELQENWIDGRWINDMSQNDLCMDQLPMNLPQPQNQDNVFPNITQITKLSNSSPKLTHFFNGFSIVTVCLDFEETPPQEKNSKYSQEISETSSTMIEETPSQESQIKKKCLQENCGKNSEKTDEMLEEALHQENYNKYLQEISEYLREIAEEHDRDLSAHREPDRKSYSEKRKPKKGKEKIEENNNKEKKLKSIYYSRNLELNNRSPEATRLSNTSRDLGIGQQSSLQSMDVILEESLGVMGSSNSCPKEHDREIENREIHNLLSIHQEIANKRKKRFSKNEKSKREKIK